MWPVCQTGAGATVKAMAGSWSSVKSNDDDGTGGDQMPVGAGGGVVMSRRLGPGPATVEGLCWLARVGPAPIDAWACAMGWAPVTARSHAARLTRVGWVERTSTKRGRGSLLFATRLGVQVAEVPVPPAPEPAPTWWAHLAGCAWAAAWLTARGREMLGPRELLLDDGWSGELSMGLGRRVVHRPDLWAWCPAGARRRSRSSWRESPRRGYGRSLVCTRGGSRPDRSEEHTSELQSRQY